MSETRKFPDNVTCQNKVCCVIHRFKTNLLSGTSPKSQHRRIGKVCQNKVCCVIHRFKTSLLSGTSPKGHTEEDEHFEATVGFTQLKLTSHCRTLREKRKLRNGKKKKEIS